MAKRAKVERAVDPNNNLASHIQVGEAVEAAVQVHVQQWVDLLGQLEIQAMLSDGHVHTEHIHPQQPQVPRHQEVRAAQLHIRQVRLAVGGQGEAGTTLSTGPGHGEEILVDDDDRGDIYIRRDALIRTDQNLDLCLQQQVVDLAHDVKAWRVLDGADEGAQRPRNAVELGLQFHADCVALAAQTVVVHRRHIRQVPCRPFLIDHEQNTIASAGDGNLAVLLEGVGDRTQVAAIQGSTYRGGHAKGAQVLEPNAPKNSIQSGGKALLPGEGGGHIQQGQVADGPGDQALTRVVGVEEESNGAVEGADVQRSSDAQARHALEIEANHQGQITQLHRSRVEVDGPLHGSRDEHPILQHYGRDVELYGLTLHLGLHDSGQEGPHVAALQESAELTDESGALLDFLVD